jgi:hypothetical protein
VAPFLFEKPANSGHRERAGNAHGADADQRHQGRLLSCASEPQRVGINVEAPGEPRQHAHARFVVERSQRRMDTGHHGQLGVEVHMGTVRVLSVIGMQVAFGDIWVVPQG